MGRLRSVAAPKEDLAKLAWFARWHALSEEWCTQEHSLRKLQENAPILHNLELNTWESKAHQGREQQLGRDCLGGRMSQLELQAASLQGEVDVLCESIQREKSSADLDACVRSAAAEEKGMQALLVAADRTLSSLADETKQYLHALSLVDARLGWCQETAVATIVSQLQAQSLEAEAQRQHRVHQERMQKLRQELLVYKARLQQLDAEAAAEAASREQDLAAREAETSKERQKRVHFREACRQKRLQELRDQRARDEEAAQQLEQRLAELASQVARQHRPEADSERLRAPTEAMLKSAMECPRVFAPMHGFSTQQIARDQRFRAIEAIRQHGVPMTPYVCRTILSAKPASATRPDNITSGGLRI
ncbi:hypothetical protein WJX84_001289 [Apatococcus fuscideae]|uniref:Uncharacterized protein n=1 Tax=Apatococcus fuscideae TaxID=2026836 RepID=A0AAW1T6Y5_9CHLO